MPNERLLDGYLTRTDIAQEINRGVRTLERWENQRIGPPVTYWQNPNVSHRSRPRLVAHAGTQPSP
jgi:hypothetical protein